MKPRNGIAVDAWCSGNPGPGGFRVKDIRTGEVLKEHKYSRGTNNLFEYLAIVSGMIYLETNGIGGTIWSDSKIGIGWVRENKVGTKFTIEPNSKLDIHMKHAKRFLTTTKSENIRIRKWETKFWGEIPADFGRK